MKVLKSFFIYIKNQIGYLSLLFFLFVIPLAMFFQFSTYPLPKVQYVVLGFLLVFQYAFYNEKKYRRKIRPKIIRQLQKERKRTPSNMEINNRTNLAVDCRDVTIILAVLAIILLMIYFKQF